MEKIIVSNNSSSKTTKSTDGSNNSSNISSNISSANDVGTLHEFLNTSSLFLSMLCNNSKGYVFLNHLSDKVNRDGMDDSSSSKANSLNLISMLLNILRNYRYHNATAIANNNN